MKIRVDDNLGTTPKMTSAVYTAVIDEAHKRGLRVAAHLYYLEDAKGLLDAGADFIAHSVRDADCEPEVISNSRLAAVCPTLMREVSTFVYESAPDFLDPFFLKCSGHEAGGGSETPPARKRCGRHERTALQGAAPVASGM